MKLLILTQKIDENDPILGFFVRWVEEFSKHCEKTIVICLEKGEYDLPSNVEVYSLGKEEGVSKFKYVWNFYKYILKTRKEYNKVFVHMNPEYIVLGGLFWKLLKKDIYLWFNHPEGNILIRTIRFLPKAIFCTSKHAFVTKYNKTTLMPAGIDTGIFKNIHQKRDKGSILALGRISPIKRLHDLTPALHVLDSEQLNYSVSVYGDAPLQDKKYKEDWAKSVQGFVEMGKMKISKSISNQETPTIYNRHSIYINLTPTGSFDKTILEAMSCGTLPIVSNKSFEEVLLAEHVFEEGDSVGLANSIKSVLSLPKRETERRQALFEEFVEREQSLDALVIKFLNIVNNK